ncbi:ArnT family glycosyltransferase [Microbacterium suaedae]|uniref:ArnT family glycosyltransferase n=1 Tax=Microbacterium suaedae TaxID=2067813 RepID=UPI0013A6619B|nr:phospholipid carrier-dependent glycosyltransferase [Microbacterium suaedae]
MLPSTWQAVMESGGSMPNGAQLDDLPAPEERSAFVVDKDLPGLVRDQMVQHPPGYYVIGAAVVTLAGGADIPWDRASALLRGLSAFLTAAAIPFIAGAVRWATGSRWAGVLGALFPLLIPWYAVSGSRISNDSLLILACSATIYALVRAWRDPRSAAWALPVAGAAYGIALGAKGYALILAPVVVVLAVGAAWRSTRNVWKTVIRILVPGAIAFAIGGWWWVRNLLILGTLQPSVLGGREHQDVAAEGYSFALFVDTFFTRLNATFWGRVGYVSNAHPSATVIAGGILLLVVIIGALFFARSRWMLALLLSYPFLIGLTIFQNAHGIYWDIGNPTRGTQGRYLYSGISALALSFAALVHGFLARRSGWLRSASVVATSALAVLIVIASLLWVIPAAWASHEESAPVATGDPVAFMGMSWFGYGAIALAAVACLVVATVTGARVASREDYDRDRLAARGVAGG